MTLHFGFSVNWLDYYTAIIMMVVCISLLVVSITQAEPIYFGSKLNKGYDTWFVVDAPIGVETVIEAVRIPYGPDESEMTIDIGISCSPHILVIFLVIFYTVRYCIAKRTIFDEWGEMFRMLSR